MPATLIPDPLSRPPVIEPEEDYDTVSGKITGAVLMPTPRLWIAGFSATFLVVMVLMGAVSYLFARGVGIWGIKIPVAWGFAIVNFVWWIGIGHAGTLISAILLLLHQDWRTSINRFTEAMTLFAVSCAGMFPLLHLGRPWFFYWLFPYPAEMRIWPQFRSPLVWDVFAVSTYFTVSLIFWFIGLMPDLATMRDTVKSRAGRVIYGTLAMGWRGSARHWRHYQMSYLLLAGLATPLVVSVHSVVSFDFSAGIVPGWHSTIFPPYFVAGAIFSGFAMVLTLVIPIRRFYHMESFITERHLDNMAKVLLATGLMVAYGYAMETFMAWYSGSLYERFLVLNRTFGPYWWVWWIVFACNVLTPQVLWFRRARTHVPLLFVVSLLVNLGMWLERYMIIVVSLSRDYVPSAWSMYSGTVWDWATLIGSMGLFLALMFLFVRGLPMMSMTELRELVPVSKEGQQP
jgi:Ni/Fe-hydrogenase subunit HybB-like protein